MSVGKRIAETIDKLTTEDYEGALIPASIAVDATASNEYPGQNNNSAFKNFVGDNFHIVTRVSSGGQSCFGILRVKYSHPRITSDANGACNVKDIFYHAVRCGLLHDAQLPTGIEFQKGNVISVRDGHVILPAEFITGLIVSVVLAPSNANETMPERYTMNLLNRSYILNDLFGQRETFLKDWNT